MILCGASETVITPPLGSPIPGQFAERRLSGVKDDLYAKAVALESDGAVILFVVIDALFILAREVRLIRERIQTAVGVLPEQVMISATHTHTGPPIWPGDDDAYLADLVSKAAEAAVAAYECRQPAQVGFGTGMEAGIAFNRRFRMRDGTVRTNPGHQHPDAVEPEGPVDPGVLVVRIDDAAGKPLAVLTNFACHADTVGGTEACADFPGSLSRHVKRALGVHTVSLFVQGASGNINHRDYRQPRSQRDDHYNWMGNKLGEEVLRVWESIGCIDEGSQLPIRSARTLFPLAYRQAAAEEVEAAQQLVQQAQTIDLNVIFADRLLQAARNPVQEEDMEIQAFRLGEWAAVGLPGELFVEFGLQLKQSAPYVGLIINTLCNGTNTGYVCTTEAYANGGYEPRLRNASRNAPGTGERFVAEAMHLLRQLRTDDQ